MSFEPGALGDGHGFSRHHRFVDCASSVEHFAVDGHRLSGPDAKAVSGGNCFKRHIPFAAIGRDPAGGFGEKSKVPGSHRLFVPVP